MVALTQSKEVQAALNEVDREAHGSPVLSSSGISSSRCRPYGQRGHLEEAPYQALTDSVVSTDRPLENDRLHCAQPFPPPRSMSMLLVVATPHFYL